MPRTNHPTLDLNRDLDRDSSGASNVTTSPLSSPMNLQGIDITSMDARDTQVSTLPTNTSVPTSPKSPLWNVEASKLVFGNHKTSRSASRIQMDTPSIRTIDDGRPSTNCSSNTNSHQRNGSTPELSVIGRSEIGSRGTSASESKRCVGVTCQILNVRLKVRPTARSSDPSRDDAQNTKSQSTAAIDFASTKNKKASNKHRFPHMLGRSTSIRTDSSSRSDKSKSESGSKPQLKPIVTPSRNLSSDRNSGKSHDPVTSLRTAPLEKDQSFRDMMNSNTRNRSADRATAVESEDDKPDRTDKADRTDKMKDKQLHHSTSHKEGGGSGFMSSFKNTSAKAAGDVGKVGRGFFGRLTRSGSSNEREVATTEDYKPSVINLPLVEQTRISRICARLADCKDKTEFWMPALPWRCIDFLNSKVEQEGLYRMGGSVAKVKCWIKAFDTKYDLNLLDETELHDVNEIGSLFKSWLRDLPDEIFPKAVQEQVAAQCQGRTQAPQALKNALSELPPYNYYLLFAITCHLSLIVSHSAKNKMTLDNLRVCFNPCMELPPWAFNLLVGDWRNCWQGCWTEKEYLREEYAYQHAQNSGPSASDTAHRAGLSVNSADERAISSSGSSKPTTGRSTPENHHTEASQTERERPLLSPASADHERNLLTPSQTNSQQEKGRSSSSKAPALPPIQPLSPIGASSVP
ncbi:hypothetical protein LTR50_001016 [Elasticomyces elasticus]|nr:hypothetical protein LTR50_001016 [Elasticomyces elasticus]